MRILQIIRELLAAVVEQPCHVRQDVAQLRRGMLLCLPLRQLRVLHTGGWLLLLRLWQWRELWLVRGLLCLLLRPLRVLLLPSLWITPLLS